MRFATILLLLFAGSAMVQPMAQAVAQSVSPDTTRLVAVEDAFAVRSDSSLSVGAVGLLSNDDFAESDSVFAVLVDPPANGSVTLERSGAFIYTPAAGFTGVDSFTYHLQTVPIQEVAIDPMLSTLLLNARVSTLIGSDNDETETPVGGTLQFIVEPNLPPYSDIRLVKMDLSLASAVGLEFRFGGILFAIGRLFVNADSGDIRLLLNQPGSVTSVTGDLFSQTDNEVGVLGNVQLRGTGVLADEVPDDPQVFDTETVMDLGGRVFLADADLFTFEMPIAFTDTVELSGTDVELSLQGTVTGSEVLRVPRLSNIVAVTLSVDPRTTTDVEGDLPAVYALDQNYPNPFNPVTRIAYSLAQAGHVRITVFDVLGREVATPVDGSATAGRHEVEFDAAHLPSGLYLYRITAGVYTDTRTMVVMK